MSLPFGVSFLVYSDTHPWDEML